MVLYFPKPVVADLTEEELKKIVCCDRVRRGLGNNVGSWGPEDWAA